MKIYWGSSVGRDYEPDHVNSIVGLLNRNPHPMYWKPLHGDALIERSRSRSATAFLKSDADVWLTVDTDIIFGAADAVTLCEQAMTHDIVVGAYTTRSPYRNFITSALTPHVAMNFETDPTPVPIVWGATGFMAVHRRVFEKLAETLPLCHPGESLEHYPFFLPFVQEVSGANVMLSEDWAFCERAKQAGFTTHLNPAIRLGHLGHYLYRLEDMVTDPPLPATPLRITRTNEGAPANYTVERPAA